ncbi:MAG: histidinol-phosphatase [Bacilli bacterium]|nr:histidinol-phosphatase [Bacilli bacterium]
MIKCDYHVHSVYCDGKNTLEEIVLSAIEKGMTELGILFHSPLSFDDGWCIKIESIPQFIEEMGVLKRKYKDSISLKIGVEMDYFSDCDMPKMEYVIGSVHSLYKNGKYYAIDNTKEEIDSLIEAYGGDVYSMLEDYFKMEEMVVKKTNATIIGHFDVISKWNQKSPFFDENDERYVNAWKRAVDKLVEEDVPFEINTGAISRGYRTEPYPSLKMIEYIKSKGGKFILSSDAHDKENLLYDFDVYEELL